jgi:hypothetical protein
MLSKVSFVWMNQVHVVGEGEETFLVERTSPLRLLIVLDDDTFFSFSIFSNSIKKFRKQHENTLLLSFVIGTLDWELEL